MTIAQLEADIIVISNKNIRIFIFVLIFYTRHTILNTQIVFLENIKSTQQIEKKGL